MFLPENVKFICGTLHNAGHQGLVVGGAVRDHLLGVCPVDYDIATDATPDEVETIFEHTYPLGKSFGVICVRLGDEMFEVATFRKDGLYSDSRRPDTVAFANNFKVDARRRDFTINAMAYDPNTNSILDHTGGEYDLGRRLVKAVGNAQSRFKEDPLRMLRAISFTRRINGRLGGLTQKAIKDLAFLITNVSQERIQAELTKILYYGSKGLRLLQTTGLLYYVLPEVNNCVGCKQSPKWHPEGDVFEHTCQVLDWTCAHDGDTAAILAAVLHDIGKPLCSEVNTKTGQIQSIGHESIGTQMCTDVMRRLKFPNDVREPVVAAVAEHMRMHSFCKMREFKRRIVMESPHWNTIYMVALADGKQYREELSSEVERLEANPIGQPLLTGAMLIEAGFPQGPGIGQALKEARLNQLKGQTTTVAKALKGAMKWQS